MVIIRNYGIIPYRTGPTGTYQCGTAKMMNTGTSIFFTSPTTYLFVLDSICFSLLMFSPSISGPLPEAATGPDKVLSLCASCLLAGAATGRSPVSEVTGSSRLVSSLLPSLGDSPYSWYSADSVAAKYILASGGTFSRDFWA
jgi:hypothetical protein